MVGGDVCPPSDLTTTDSTALKRLWEGVLSDFEEADVSIVNLECPITNSSETMLKSGPCLSRPIEIGEKVLAVPNITAACLANNHIMDYKEAGLQDTLDACERLGIRTVGVGATLELCRKPLELICRGRKIVVYAMAEAEFSVVRPGRPGANPIDPLQFVRDKKAREGADYVIVLLHGGLEHYPYPTPRMQNIARFLIEEGANLVVFQHSHCPGCFEEYREGTIVYGQGNLMFPWPGKGSQWYVGFLVRVAFKEGQQQKVELLPYQQWTGGPGIKKLDAAAEADLLRDIERRSKEVTDWERVEELWKSHCERRRSYYFSLLRGHNRALRFLSRNKTVRQVLFRLKRRAMRVVSNAIRCESHRDAIVTTLEGMLDEC